MKLAVLSAIASVAAIIAPTIAQTPSGYAPATSSTFTIKFGDTVVTPGGSVKLQDTATAPTIDFSNVSGDSTHIITMLDLDAPMGDTDRSYSPLLHWMSVIPAGNKNGDGANDVAVYVGPQPPVGYGPHRYVLLLLTDPSAEFHLPSGFENATYADITSRLQFPTDKFIAAGNFQLAAANWFTTENITTTTTSPSNTTNATNATTSTPVSAGASILHPSVVGGIFALVCLPILWL